MRKAPSATADKTLLLIITFLLLFGIVMIYNATVVFAQGTFGEAYRLVLLHIGWVVLGLVGFFLFYKMEYKRLKSLAYPLFGVSLIPLGILALAGLLRKIGISECSLESAFVPCVNGATRWFNVNPPPLPQIPVLGTLGFQPSEFVKLTTVLYLAVALERIITNKSNKVKGENDAFTLFIVVTGFLSFLILMQPNLSTAVLVFAIGMSMYFTSGATLKPFFAMIPILGVLGVLFITSASYRLERLKTFLNSSGTDDLASGYHIKQILIALGSGGFFGVGFGQSRQKFSYLPEVAADSIFAIIGEELGFVGTTIIIFVFSLLIYKGFTIAKEAPDLFGRLLAVGVTTWLSVQFFVNVAAMTRLIPLTGVPLPLISYGGSSTVFSLMGLGILASVSKHTAEV